MLGRIFRACNAITNMILNVFRMPFHQNLLLSAFSVLAQP